MSEIMRYGEYLLKPRHAVPDCLWNDYVDRHPDGCWWHRAEWLDYCLAYAGGTDHSMAIVQGSTNTVVALCPLIDERGHFKGGRNPLAFALCDTLDLNPVIGGYVQQVNQRQRILTGEFMTVPVPPDRETYDIESDDIIEDISFKTRVIDLAMPRPELKANIRKSYRQFIDKHDIIAGGSIVFEMYEQLHRDEYGNPRSPETYAIQKSWCEAGFGRVYLIPSVTSPSRLADAATLWILYKGHAYYASGVAHGKNLMHGLTWYAMNDLHNLGIRYAELGWQGIARTTREQNIEFFKRGFGGEDWVIKAARFYYGATEVHRGTA